MRRLVVLVVALVALTVVPAAPGRAAPKVVGQAADPASVEPATVQVEHEFVADINALRVSKGLKPLAVHDELVSVARSWAASMAKADQISHNPKLAQSVKADWQKLGENVGVGMTEDKLHQAFIDSPSHYKNLVDGDFTFIGVGVVYGRDGAIFTAHQFMQLRPAAAAAAGSEATTSPKPAPTTTAPPAPAPAPADEELVAPPAAPAPIAARTPPARLVLVLEQLRAFDPR